MIAFSASGSALRSHMPANDSCNGALQGAHAADHPLSGDAEVLGDSVCTCVMAGIETLNGKLIRYPCGNSPERRYINGEKGRSGHELPAGSGSCRWRRFRRRETYLPCSPGIAECGSFDTGCQAIGNELIACVGWPIDAMTIWPASRWWERVSRRQRGWWLTPEPDAASQLVEEFFRTDSSEKHLRFVEH